MKRILSVLSMLSFLGLAACQSSPSGPSEVRTPPPTPPPDLTPPPTPTAASPANGSVFSYYPRDLTLVWNAVSDPSGVTYRVEVQADGGGWFQLPAACSGVITGTTCRFKFVGAQPGRWRVQAVDGMGNASAMSVWSYFKFTI